MACQNFASKFMVIIALFLVAHHALVARCAQYDQKEIQLLETFMKMTHRFGQDFPYDDDDSQEDLIESRNQANLNEIKDEGDNGMPLEEYSDDEEYPDQQSDSPKESSVQGETPLAQDPTNGVDSDDFSVEQQPASVTEQVERGVDPFFSQDQSNCFPFFLLCVMCGCVVCCVLILWNFNCFNFFGKRFAPKIAPSIVSTLYETYSKNIGKDIPEGGLHPNKHQFGNDVPVEGSIQIQNEKY